MSDIVIDGRDQDKAVLLLAAAADLDLDASVVRTTSKGYVVPDEVAKKAGLVKKAPAKKTAAKKAAEAEPKGEE